MYYDRRVFQLCGPSHISPNNNSVLNNKFKKWKCERCYYTFELLVASRNNLWVYLIIARAYHIFILTFFPRIRIFKKIRIRFRQHIVLYNNHPAPYRLSRVRIFQFKNFPLSRIEPRNLLARRENFTSFFVYTRAGINSHIEFLRSSRGREKFWLSSLF